MRPEYRRNPCSRPSKSSRLETDGIYGNATASWNEISATDLSKLEGQSRRVTDQELSIIAAALHTTPNTLLK